MDGIVAQVAVLLQSDNMSQEYAYMKSVRENIADVLQTKGRAFFNIESALDEVKALIDVGIPTGKKVLMNPVLEDIDTIGSEELEELIIFTKDVDYDDELYRDAMGILAAQFTLFRNNHTHNILTRLMAMLYDGNYDNIFIESNYSGAVSKILGQIYNARKAGTMNIGKMMAMVDKELEGIAFDEEWDKKHDKPDEIITVETTTPASAPAPVNVGSTNPTGFTNPPIPEATTTAVHLLTDDTAVDQETALPVLEVGIHDKIEDKIDSVILRYQKKMATQKIKQDKFDEKDAATYAFDAEAWGIEHQQVLTFTPNVHSPITIHTVPKDERMKDAFNVTLGHTGDGTAGGLISIEQRDEIKALLSALQELEKTYDFSSDSSGDEHSGNGKIPLSEELKDILRAPTLYEQKEIIKLSRSTETSHNIFCRPIIHRVVKGFMYTTINYVDKYVNVTRLLEFAHLAGYSPKKTFSAWISTRMGKLLMKAGEMRYKDGVIHPLLGKLDVHNIRMAYRINRRIIKYPCVLPDAHKGVYVHPRIAHHIAMWVSNEFALLFEDQFEDMIEEYLEFPDIESEPEPRFNTPMLPTKRQVLLSRRRGVYYESGNVSISMGDRAYINTIRRRANVNVMYYGRSMPLTTELFGMIKGTNVKSNVYSFGNSEGLNKAIEQISAIDQMPQELAEIWQDSTFRIEQLGTVTQEQKRFDYAYVKDGGSLAKLYNMQIPGWIDATHYRMYANGVEKIIEFSTTGAFELDKQGGDIKFVS
jgi:hypothetical protein